MAQSNNPFATKAATATDTTAAAAPAPAPEQAPQAAPAPTQAAPAPQPAPTQAPAAPAQAPVAGDDGTVKKPRKTPSKQLTKEQRKYVIQNYAAKSTSEIAQELGATPQQVYRTVNESRKSLKTRLEAAQTENNQAKIAKIQEILAKLPEKAFGGGGNSKKNSTDSALDDLIDI